MMMLSKRGANAGVRAWWEPAGRDTGKAFVGSRAHPRSSQGTCFHSYINVVEVRRSGIPVSDPLHELCFPHIDFHPTLVGGRRQRRGEKRKAEEEEGRESPLQTASKILWK